MARRSVLFSPGDRPELMRKAPATGADAVVFDLEDAVAPGRRAEAREAVAAVLTDPDFDPEAEVVVRLGDPSGDLDAVLVEDARIDAVMTPKVAAAADVERLADRLADRGAALPAFALVESAAGVLAADEIAAADPVDAVAFGAEDFAADVGATRTAGGEEVTYARQRVVAAAAAAGVDAVDTVFTDFEDEAGLRAEAERAVEWGFDGKLAIHPAQVDPINDAFTPEEAAIEWAERVLDARDHAAADDRAVFEVDGEMIDAPLIAQAERIVERAAAAGVR